ncbi:unnamed protein product (macronuclear) [Paramecium tetraurelia]|uniref:Uncharacterized protein n=1 Tax=Paramecium tetraurelia TaxID=5888 RepID=A0EHS4_PARTE|nr:uncharacterized protein GSPATT00027191001 [Paramecium tetraurelia]CAK94865.1 unnamed protein product [Paramecium tetraurelia]|eukprot:XP_001462238.1 hypothetical protein (macronuclear) [Paramecium tetraurelia strain d4-2]
MSQLASIGIDFGSQRSVIAAALRGGVKILDNEGAHRETQNVIGFTAEERFIGEQGALQQKSNFKNSIGFFNRFLGIQGKQAFLAEEMKWLTVPTSIHESGKTLFEVTYLGQKANFTPEQLTGTMLNKLKHIIQLNDINISSSNVCISVPAYYTESERKALIDACKIADIPLERLLNETTAIAINYGLFRKTELDPKTPRNVAFVDLGHSKFSAFVGSFYKEKAQVLAQVCERNLGARDIDWVLFEKFATQFEIKTSGLSVRKNAKGRLRLLEAIEKARKVLSANSEAQINVEYLVEDEDFNTLIKRDEFEQLAQPVLLQIQAQLELLYNQVQNLKLQLHSVEIVGGATRIPAVQRLIEKIFKIEQVSRTLNASESISRGCGMMAAMRSPNFRVTEYKIEDCNYYPIRVGWLYDQKLNKLDQSKGLARCFPEKQCKILFEQNNPIPSIKSFTLMKTQPIQLTLFYDPVPQGFDPIIQQVQVPPLVPKHKEHTTKIKVLLDQNGLLNLEEVVLIEEFMEDVKVPVEKQKLTTSEKQEEGQQQQKDAQVQKEVKVEEPEYEIKQKKKTIQSQVNCETTCLYSLTKKEIDHYFQQECEMLNNDNQIHETQFKKNQLESYIYSWRENLNGKYAENVKPELKERILKELDLQYEWLYGDGQKTTKREYSDRYDRLVSLCGPIATIADEYRQIPEVIQEVQKYSLIYENFVNSQDQQYAHISIEERNLVANELKLFNQWCYNTIELLKNADKTVRFAISVQQVNTKYVELQQKCQPIVTKPKPESIKEEKVIDDTKQQQQNNVNGNKMETE